jgi:formate hydrogenlyase subunit 6/NADH:ubiquinone oxidoreductase subunit I
MLFEVLKNLFRKPATRLYPKEKVQLPKGFRGKHIVKIDKCIFCKRCENVCPTEAIKVDRERRIVTINFAECIFCGECIKACPKNAIKQTGEMLLASEEKQRLEFK